MSRTAQACPVAKHLIAFAKRSPKYTMPNGHDKNWIRLCGAIDGFRVRYGRWPDRVRMFPICLDDIRNCLFTPADLAAIVAKVKLIADDGAETIAEDDTGASYNYGKEGFPTNRPKPGAAEWLGVKPKPEQAA